MVFSAIDSKAPLELCAELDLRSPRAALVCAEPKAPVSDVFAGSCLLALLEELSLADRPVTPRILTYGKLAQKDATFSRRLRRKPGENRPGEARNDSGVR